MRNICPLNIMFIIIITTYILRIDVYIYIYFIKSQGLLLFKKCPMGRAK